jgi:hypothetical protein
LIGLSSKYSQSETPVSFGIMNFDWLGGARISSDGHKMWLSAAEECTQILEKGGALIWTLLLNINMNCISKQ